ncbi:TetR/AcrR family transcriptional regulator [uncultured Sunxiuqinia sp.]|uniref:TetR/AcrR family transcriptional regulator n=1 Tax=uncultured Sunxiuqinia sp. TaxID=1573825 RepID=UPI002AA7D5F3|nr:TetR/AcrR family transcriptional regulator [uncultured Sunxiuqinia sp.]
MSGKDEIVKREILVEAQRLFQQFGLKKTTMDEIAEACGKAKSTLYHYFKSKDEVFGAVIQLEMLNLRQFVKNKVEEHKTMLDKIKTYVIEFHKEVVNKVNLYRLIRQDSKLFGFAKDKFLKMMEFEQSYIVRILEDGFDSGEYNTSGKEDIPWIAEMFLASFYGVVQYGVEKDGYYNEEKIERIVELVVPRLFT